MSRFATRLKGLAHPPSYPNGRVINRWGQVLRETPEMLALLQGGMASGHLVPLHEVATIHGGAVTRANAYFIVRELPFEQIPNRFRLTRQDYRRVAVVMDGLEVPCRIERPYLRTIIKGPESLLTPSRIQETDQRVLLVNDSKEDLRKRNPTGLLDYLKRGETVPYRVSEDSLKGGVPAERPMIRDRRPFWYTITVHNSPGRRIIVPEHLDRRYIATMPNPDDGNIVIDKLYILDPKSSEDADLLLASLNSLMTWYQLELRGRTQLGQGVLELKEPDWSGVLVLNPVAVGRKERRSLASAFRPLLDQVLSDSLSAVSDPDRVEYDLRYLRLANIGDAEGARLEVERALRAAASERHERRESVAGSKLERATATRVTAVVDAYAAKLAALLASSPDPRAVVPAGTECVPVPVQVRPEGRITAGDDLFTHGNVYAGTSLVAETDSPLAARYVRAVLLHEPTLSHVDVPRQPALGEIIRQWNLQNIEWRARFERVAEETLTAVSDQRTRAAVVAQALTILHAQ